MSRAGSLLAVLAVTAMAMTEVISIDPVRASWSGKVIGDPELGGVSQVITLNVDTLKQVDVFIGFNEGNDNYNINGYSRPDGPEPLTSGVLLALDAS